MVPIVVEELKTVRSHVIEHPVRKLDATVMMDAVVMLDDAGASEDAG